jgi:hypothetical protein
MSRKPSPATAVAVIAVVAASTGVAVAAIPDRNGTITACYAKKGGSVRIIDVKKKCRSKTEKRISWNQAGKDGAAGTPGAPGQNGTAGTNGTNGADGTDATIPPVEARRVVGQPGQPGFASPWTTSTGFDVPSFWKDRDGVVHLEGNSFHAGGPNTTFETIFTLPAGYRPTDDLRFPVTTGVAGSSTTLRVAPDGDVSPEEANISGAAITLDGVTFRAEQ